jgi:hypothetical protein
MQNTKLILTPENKNYLILFLGDYLVQCGKDMNEIPKKKLIEFLNVLIPD